MYHISFTQEAKKTLKKLEHKEQKRIVATLERISTRPHAFVKKLVASPYFRIRSGKYRIIVDIQAGELIILVLEIGHRRNIYK